MAETASNPGSEENEATFNNIADLDKARYESMSDDELTGHFRDRIENMDPTSPEAKSAMQELQEIKRDRANSQTPHSGEVQEKRDAA